jgi:hypothetical protein
MLDFIMDVTIIALTLSLLLTLVILLGLVVKSIYDLIVNDVNQE